MKSQEQIEQEANEFVLEAAASLRKLGITTDHYSPEQREIWLDIARDAYREEVTQQEAEERGEVYVRPPVILDIEPK